MFRKGFILLVINWRTSFMDRLRGEILGHVCPTLAIDVGLDVCSVHSCTILQVAINTEASGRATDYTSTSSSAGEAMVATAQPPPLVHDGDEEEVQGRSQPGGTR